MKHTVNMLSYLILTNCSVYEVLSVDCLSNRNSTQAFKYGKCEEKKCFDSVVIESEKCLNSDFEYGIMSDIGA